MRKTLMICILLAISLGSIYFLNTSETKSPQAPIYLHEKLTTSDSQLDIFKSLTNAGNSIIVFYADWCIPCKNTAPIIENLALTLPQITFIKVDITICADITSYYNLKGVPTILFLKNGEELQRKVGAIKSREEVIEIIKNIF